jgi:N-methylhydantoinase B
VRAPEEIDGRLSLTLNLHHQQHAPFGLAGGRASEPTMAFLDGEEVPARDVPARLGAVTFGPSTGIVRIRTAGGGGHGDPADRDTAAVLADVRDGLLSAEDALSVYGVSVDLDALSATRAPGQP